MSCHSSSENSYWYIASYPKSGNTWCRLFISQIIKSKSNEKETNNRISDDIFEIDIGLMASSMEWLSDQFGIDCEYLRWEELDKYRSKLNNNIPVFSEYAE